MTQLESELECELDRARTADLVQRVEAAVGSSNAQGIRQRLRRPAEQRAGQAVGGKAEVRVVQKIEELGPEAKSHALGYPEDSLQSQNRLA